MVLADVNSADQRPKPFFIISQKAVGDSAKEKRYNQTKRKGTHLRASNFRLGQHHQGGGRSFLQNLMYGTANCTNISLQLLCWPPAIHKNRQGVHRNCYKISIRKEEKSLSSIRPNRYDFIYDYFILILLPRFSQYSSYWNSAERASVKASAASQATAAFRHTKRVSTYTRSWLDWRVNLLQLRCAPSHTHSTDRQTHDRMDEWAGSLLAFFPLSKIKEEEEENGAAVSTILYTHVERSLVYRVEYYTWVFGEVILTLSRVPKPAKAKFALPRDVLRLPLCAAAPPSRTSHDIRRGLLLCVYRLVFLCVEKEKIFSKHFLIWRHQSSGCCGAVAFWYIALGAAAGPATGAFAAYMWLTCTGQ